MLLFALLAAGYIPDIPKWPEANLNRWWPNGRKHNATWNGWGLYFDPDCWAANLFAGIALSPSKAQKQVHRLVSSFQTTSKLGTKDSLHKPANHEVLSAGSAMEEEEERTSVPPEGPTVEETSEDSPNANTETRLMITKIVCENFKSYAGVRELGPFHKVSWLVLSKLT